MQTFRTFPAAGAIALAAFAVTAPAWAQTQPLGPYISGALGVTQPQDWELKGGTISTEQESDMGFAGAIALGTKFSPNWRAEAEFSYSNADV